MGKYGIGVRVRDPDGDLAEITGKPGKGLREVRLIGGKLDGLLLEYRKSSLEVGGLRLEIGKTYVDREGTQRGPLVANNDGPFLDTHPFGDGDGVLCWRADGGFLQKGDDPWDLIAEASSASSCAEKCEVAFSVGQRVVAKGRGYGDTTEVGVVFSTCSSGCVVEFDDGWTGGHSGGADEANENRWFFSLSDLTPFTLEAGKFYRTRDGRKVGPMEDRGGFFHNGGYGQTHYAVNGISAYSGRLPADPGRTHNDIGAEWVEPEVEETIVVEDATDTVFTVIAGKRYRGKSGAEYDVVANYGNEFWPLKAPGGKRFWRVDGTAWDGRLGVTGCPAGDDLVAMVEPQTKFKVGDVVDLYRDGEPVAAWLNMTITATGGYFYEYETDVGLPCLERELRLSSERPALPLGTRVILTGTVSGNSKAGVNILVDGVPDATRSHAFPATALRAA